MLGNLWLRYGWNYHHFRWGQAAQNDRLLKKRIGKGFLKQGFVDPQRADGYKINNLFNTPDINTVSRQKGLFRCCFTMTSISKKQINRQQKLGQI